eukprot:GHVS01036197.1.p1 GENE.GHVS01036197.1~~GHVS01036197.1.p1  ORF type:complete len:372 (-),score=98.78 GHVS01036197.1:351-1466(-)
MEHRCCEFLSVLLDKARHHYDNQTTTTGEFRVLLVAHSAFLRSLFAMLDIYDAAQRGLANCESRHIYFNLKQIQKFKLPSPPPRYTDTNNNTDDKNSNNNNNEHNIALRFMKRCCSPGLSSALSPSYPTDSLPILCHIPLSSSNHQQHDSNSNSIIGHLPTTTTTSYLRCHSLSQLVNKSTTLVYPFSLLIFPPPSSSRNGYGETNTNNTNNSTTETTTTTSVASVDVRAVAVAKIDKWIDGLNGFGQHDGFGRQRSDSLDAFNDLEDHDNTAQTDTHDIKQQQQQQQQLLEICEGGRREEEDKLLFDFFGRFGGFGFDVFSVESSARRCATSTDGQICCRRRQPVTPASQCLRAVNLHKTLDNKQQPAVR